MTAQPWLLSEAQDAAPHPACHVCGRPLPAQGVIFAQPHRYHTSCYTAFHAALWAKENAGKTVAQIRALVAEDVRKGRAK